MPILLFVLLCSGLLAQGPDPAAMAAEARQAMAAARYPQAADLYRKVVALLPKVAGLRLNLGLALFQSGKYTEAAAQLRTALQLEPGLAPAGMLLGLCHAKLGEPALALPLLERAHQADPRNPIVLLELADAHFALGRNAEAARLFEQVTVMQPANPLAWRGLGLSLTESAQELFAKLPPDGAEALTLAAKAKLARQEPKAAFQLLQRALAANPAFGPAHAALAELYRAQGQAAWAETAAAKAGPGNPAFLAVAEASQKALEALGRLEALGPSAELFETQAESARAAGDYPAAVAALRRALATRPSSAPLERNLARALFQNKEYEEALPLLAKYKLKLELGTAFVELGRPAEAIPQLLGQKTPAAQAQLGRAYLATGQAAKAVPTLRAGLAADSDGSIHFQLARALQRTGQPAQAAEMDRISQQIRERKSADQSALGDVEITPP